MGSKSNYFANKVVSLFRGSSISAITAYVGLFSTAPSDESPGTELTAGGYARELVTFHTIDDVTIGNDTVVTFGPPTVDWGNVVGWGIFDASTGGNYLLFDEFPDPIRCDTAANVRFEEDELIYSED